MIGKGLKEFLNVINETALIVLHIVDKKGFGVRSRSLLVCNRKNHTLSVLPVARFLEYKYIDHVRFNSRIKILEGA